ncbi:hypothetical protein PV325_005763 [Microctonus aethiopoides]|uniref:hydroxyisourate hydrolase n=2 Tax=Microctonus aethiopoides TaxID=144406 RepID=A0AA39FY10_9HYME|nr:hypothetical protein PV325_005763 [Microctonus aethiopoides]KAK0094688.1 hypothetical protein PV326_010299 [Microctonus aethiopoides]KAK0177914.1 hypothetical protein PV328_001912 [Microctonus aethiopoides]
MEKNEITKIVIDGDQALLCSEIYQTPQRLTPTGKISHAKTRVYTQRYRKEWEQMPDFKGWLTSVPGQLTRAFCTYCKKNLHAHRLSLLKHTCTMKHQRAALMHQAESNEAKLNDTNNEDKMIEFTPQFEEVNIQSIKTDDTDNDEDIEDDNDYEYVVERLEMEQDDESNELKNDHDYDDHNDEDDNNEKNDVKLNSIDNDDMPCKKKIKVDSNDCRDTLAEAMAHVHGEYLDNPDDDNQNQLNTDCVNQELSSEIKNINDSTINNVIDDQTSTIKVDMIEVDNEKTHDDNKVDLSMGNCPTSNEPKLVAYQINPSQLSLVSSGQQQQQANTATLTISPIQNKTVMLSTGKTVTLTAGKLPAGYVLSKVKGNLPTLVVSGGNKLMNSRPILPKLQPISMPKLSHSQYELASDNNSPGPSQSVDKKVGIIKNISVPPARISTHVIDTSKGAPIAGLQVSLYKLMDGRWTFLNESTTSPSGRCSDLVDMKKSQITAGRYKIHFDVDKYFTLRRIETMYPFIEIVFDVKNPTGNYHIPILLSPFSYTTYRGPDR